MFVPGRILKFASAVQEQRTVHRVSAGGVNYTFSLSAASDVKRTIGKDARDGLISWVTAAKLCNQVVQIELGANPYVADEEPSRLPPMKVDVVHFLGRDMPALAAIEEASNDPFWDVDEFKSVLEDRNTVCLVASAISVHEPLGFAVVRFGQSGSRNVLELLNIAVHPTYRRRRIGSQLICDIAGRLRPQTRPTLDAMVRENNMEALKFLQSNKFLADPRVRRDYFDFGLDGYLMQRWHD